MTNSRKSTPSRRQFVGLLGTTTVGGMGISGTASAQEIPIVSMGNNYFDPVGLYVEPGTTIRFEIEAGTHSATAYEDRIPSEATPFDSGTMSQGEFEYTFETPGTYDYYCIPHESMGMVGRIVVGEPGGPAEVSLIPEGNVPDSELIVEEETIPIDEFDDVDDGKRGEMMGSESGMRNGRRSGWMMLMPIGFMATILGLISGVAYWASRKATIGGTYRDRALKSHTKQYTQRDIDKGEFDQQVDSESHQSKSNDGP